MRRPRRYLAAACLLVTAACSNPFGGGGVGRTVSVFNLKPGDCLTPQKQVQQQIANVTVVPCSTPHTQEAYARVPDDATNSQNPGSYPGDAALTTFAEGACAQRFGSYVGTSYQDSSLFFTYLLPSARSWEQASDRTVICFVTTTGASLHRSVKGSRL